ncbi:MAG: outer membrane beta-barrel protein [Bacteroidia bacterium]|nr:outer membrane beta-barrel protein [Bacteroidia bacterium]
MKNIKNSIPLCILAFFLISFSINAQEVNCSQNYEAALKLYNYGMADSALAILKPCLENKKALDKVSRETGANIFRLAALSSIMKGDPSKAEEYVKQLLKYQPDYKNNLRVDDLMEFRLMVSNTSSQPSLRLGITAGANMPFVKLQKKYSDYETSFGEAYSLERSFGYQFGIAGEKTLTKNISIEVAAGITRILFKYSIKSQTSGQNQYDESLTWVEIPVLTRYYFSTNSSFKPYLQGGVSGKFSLYAMEKSDVYGKYWFTKSSSSDKILTTFLTDIEQVGLVLGGGVGYDLKKFNIRLDFRYNHNFKNSNLNSKFNSITGYDDIDSGEKFHYTDDINLVSLKDIQISIGFLYNLNYKVF